MEGYGFEAYEEQRRAVDADEVREIFVKAAKDHGYEKADCTVEGYADFKVRWVRASEKKCINWMVSDYLVGAPRIVVEDVATVVMARISGEEADYTAESKEYMSSAEFAERCQPVLVERHGYKKGLATKGREFVKEASKGGDVPEGIAFVYTDAEHMQVSALMRVVAIPTSMRKASKEALWFAFDKGVRKIAKGAFGGHEGEFGTPLVFVNITDEDWALLADAGVLEE